MTKPVLTQSEFPKRAENKKAGDTFVYGSWGSCDCKYSVMVDPDDPTKLIARRTFHCARCQNPP